MRGEDEVRKAIDHLFRHKAGQMVSVLARKFGVAHIELIEDAVQDAMIAALKKWPYSGVPADQTAWLIQVAKNRVIDQLRREAKSDSIEGDEIDLVARESAEPQFEGELSEDQIRMMFACCHPDVPADSRVALTLKIVGGFSVGEIARAYLAKDEAIAKMLTRAKQKLRTVELEIPAGEELRERLDAVLRVLYLMFNEGYSASEGEALIRQNLCFEAIRLAGLLLEHPVTSLPKVHAVVSLFMFQAARLATRTDGQGDLLLLADQDRSLWDKAMLASGLAHLRQAAGGDELTDYHIEAEIASLHALAPDFGLTDWKRIISCYDRLQSRQFSPVVELNRIVAIGYLHGPDRAVTELRELGQNYLMTSFNLFHITLGYFLAESGESKSGVRAYERALELTKNDAVKRFLRQKIKMLESGDEL